MPDQVQCEICGKRLDPRGLQGHRRFAHNGGKSQADGGELLADDEMSDAEVLDVAPQAQKEGNAIMFRNEIRVTDAEAKKELIKALKKRIQGHGTMEI